MERQTDLRLQMDNDLKEAGKREERPKGVEGSISPVDETTDSIAVREAEKPTAGAVPPESEPDDRGHFRHEECE